MNKKEIIKEIKILEEEIETINKRKTYIDLNKQVDSEKIHWFNSNKDNLLEMKHTAKEPKTFEILLNAWNDHLTGKLCHTPIEIDATNSFAQIMSVLLKSNQIAETCNVVNAENNKGITQVADLYLLVSDRMSMILFGKIGAFNRKEIKASLMQYSYGQQEKGTKKQLADDLGSKYTDEVYTAFVSAVEYVIPGFSEVMYTINSMWRYEWLETSWTMPDGFKVVCKPTSQQWVDFKLFGKYPIKGKVSGVGHEEKALILYVTIIHSCDAFCARELIRMANYDKAKLTKNYDIILKEIHKRKIQNDNIKDDIKN